MTERHLFCRQSEYYILGSSKSFVSHGFETKKVQLCGSFIHIGSDRRARRVRCADARSAAPRSRIAPHDPLPPASATSMSVSAPSTLMSTARRRPRRPHLSSNDGGGGPLCHPPPLGSHGAPSPVPQNRDSIGAPHKESLLGHRDLAPRTPLPLAPHGTVFDLASTCLALPLLRTATCRWRIEMRRWYPETQRYTVMLPRLIETPCPWCTERRCHSHIATSAALRPAPPSREQPGLLPPPHESAATTATRPRYVGPLTRRCRPRHYRTALRRPDPISACLLICFASPSAPRRADGL
ncbi:hypothetical protein C8J57DRAFT_159900 [Mycena rebaudengoi]|nr:hypothetical protein C8J57DRAFT_159900 [Mycena rebaudengoi]